MANIFIVLSFDGKKEEEERKWKQDIEVIYIRSRNIRTTARLPNVQYIYLTLHYFCTCKNKLPFPLVANWTFFRRVYSHVFFTWKTCEFSQFSTMVSNWTQKQVKNPTTFWTTFRLVAKKKMVENRSKTGHKLSLQGYFLIMLHINTFSDKHVDTINI